MPIDLRKMNVPNHKPEPQWPPPPTAFASEREEKRSGNELAGIVAFALVCLCILNLLIAIISGFLPDGVVQAVSKFVMMLVGLPAGLIGVVIGSVTFDTRWGRRTVILAVALITALILGVAGMVAMPPHIEY